MHRHRRRQRMRWRLNCRTKTWTVRRLRGWSWQSRNRWSLKKRKMRNRERRMWGSGHRGRLSRSTWSARMLSPKRRTPACWTCSERRCEQLAGIIWCCEGCRPQTKHRMHPASDAFWLETASLAPCLISCHATLATGWQNEVGGFGPSKAMIPLSGAGGWRSVVKTSASGEMVVIERQDLRDYNITEHGDTDAYDNQCCLFDPSEASAHVCMGTGEVPCGAAVQPSGDAGGRSAQWWRQRVWPRLPGSPLLPCFLAILRNLSSFWYTTTSSPGSGCRVYEYTRFHFRFFRLLLMFLPDGSACSAAWSLEVVSLSRLPWADN